MIRAWLAIALLAISWLWGLGYYGPSGAWWFAAAVAAGTLLLGGLVGRLPGRRDAGAALALLVPAVWLMPWPYRAAPLLVAAGLALEVVAIPRRWPGWLARAAVAAGAALLTQMLAILAYAAHTSAGHDLPGPLASMVGGIGWLLGAETTVDGHDVVFRVLGRVHRLGATWDLLVDPPTVCFLVGGLVVLGLAAWSRLPVGRRWSPWLRSVRALAAVVVAWLPVRVALLVALYLHRSLRADPTTTPNVMNQFLSPWVSLALLAGLVLLAARFVPWPEGGLEEATPQESAAGAAPSRPWRLAAALGLVCLGVSVLCAAIYWDPVGRPKGGRVMVVERHSAWEPTTHPYDTEVYGERGSYNYAAVYDYCGQYFEMSRLLESDPIDQQTLGRCDVLVVKTPTSRFSGGEVDAIERFVRDGGGLLLIGDHTNVFRSSTFLNDIARQFGFTFRNDLLFHVGSPYRELYRRPVVPHPAVLYQPPMDFEVSCSIDPGKGDGRAVIRGTGLWSLPPAYESSNYHPPALYQPEMRYGPFIQLWAARSGGGRVLAFTDSTIFSNFCTFQPGKAEMLVGMLQWLNHTSSLDRNWLRRLVVIPLGLVGLVLSAAGLVGVRRRPAAWVPALAAGLLGWTLASLAVTALARWQMPRAELLRPMTRVVIDRTVCETPLSKGAFVESKDGKTSYGLFEQWIPRLGCYTTRRSGPEAFSGDALVVICPNRSVDAEFRRGLVRYVAGGGKLLVLDSPDIEDSTANSLLWPFGLAVSHTNTGEPGEVIIADGWPKLRSERACEISGGEPFAWLGKLPVGATARYGGGTVTAIGFGSLLSDAGMGLTWEQEPDAQTRKVYGLMYALVRAVLSGRPVEAPRPATPSGKG